MICFVHVFQVRMHRMNATDAAGPTLARALASRLYNKETYWMQVDGHSRCAWRLTGFSNVHHLSK